MDYPARILLVGNGGRECALANALLSSAQLERLYIAPPNHGVLDPHQPDGRRIELLQIAATDSAALVAAAQQHAVQLVVVGPEAPLCAGLADELRAAGIAAVGPGAEAARLEGSKAYAKEFMRAAGIPTADFEVFDALEPLLAHLEQRGDAPCVLKADGLAAGKGVVICDGLADAKEAARQMYAPGEKGAERRVLVEERLSGCEISFTCLISGGAALLLPPSSDYKRLRDGDEGPNTGGMGNMAPSPYATEAVVAEFHARGLTPFLGELERRGLDYRGFLFIGAMVTEHGLMVLEFNVRLGDPEAAVVLPLCDADWPAVFAALAAGEPPDVSKMHVREGACVAVVVASSNYPYAKSEPAPIEGLERVRERGLLLADDAHGDVQVLFAGVDMSASCELLATGGRVLTVSARAANLSLARRLAYEVVGNLRFDGMQFRSDVGKNLGDWPGE